MNNVTRTAVHWFAATHASLQRSAQRSWDTARGMYVLYWVVPSTIQNTAGSSLPVLYGTAQLKDSACLGLTLSKKSEFGQVLGLSLYNTHCKNRYLLETFLAHGREVLFLQDNNI